MTTQHALERARVAGKKATTRLAVAVDTALIAQGKAARARQRKRALNSALKVARKAVLVAGAAAATVVAVRASKRAALR